MSDKIICPFCKAEYDGSEIYVADAFFGRPKVIRNEKHGIERTVGKVADRYEEYVCDYCNNAFQVEATVDYTTKAMSKADFRNEEYVQKLRK